MATLSAAQRSALVSWRTALNALSARLGLAQEFLNGLMTIDEQVLLNGAITFAVDWWPNQGDRWNDFRDQLVDKAEALPQYEPS